MDILQKKLKRLKKLLISEEQFLKLSPAKQEKLIAELKTFTLK